MKKLSSKYMPLLLLLLLCSCIKNDIPYPIIVASITDIEAEHMIGSARINSNDHTVSFVVDDAVNLKALRLTRLLYTDEATLQIPKERMANPIKFPDQPFIKLDDLPMSADTRLDLSSPLDVVLSTYQDYPWTLSVTQQIERTVMVEGQVGNAVIDPDTHKVVIYVDSFTDLNKVKVQTFTLGGEHGKVVPDPCGDKYIDGYNFSTHQTFYVQQAWEETSTEWQVFVYKADDDTPDVETSVFARTISATIQASGAPSNCIVQYRKENSAEWMTDAKVIRNGTRLTAELNALSPASDYEYRVISGDKILAKGAFDTTEATPLPDGSLDNWFKDGKLWNPWAQNGDSFWDTGNKGAITISDSNSVPTDETSTGSGHAAYLESKYLVMKFAAGNLFTGTYVRTDGTNGVLDFGRPFSAFPTHLRFSYKYHSEIINRVGDNDLEYMKGRPDSCSIYVILADWDQPFTIRTRKSERSLIDPEHDEHILAYSVLSTSESNTEYKEYTLPIHYKITNRKPKYIVVVASASKYGDYFTGGEGSCLWVDNFELLYKEE